MMSDVIYTDNFKRWFGDWENDPENSSKVVDESGKPLVVYHGTSRYGEFDSFKGNTFFSDNEDMSSWYTSTDEEWSEDQCYRNYDRIYSCYLNIRNPLVVDAKENIWDDILFEGKEITTDELINTAKSRGYDGLIVKNVIEASCDFGDDYVIFSPNQAKSATDNNGEFNPESDKFNEDIKSNIKNSDKDQVQKFAQLVADYKYSLYGEKIIKKGRKWQVTDHTGKKNLGTYDTKKDAEERLKQVEMFKHMNEYTKKDFIEDIDAMEKEAVNQYQADENPLRKSAAEGKIVACEDIKDLADNLPNTSKGIGPEDLMNESAPSYFGIVAADGGLVRGSVSDNIDKVKELRTILAKKYKSIFKIKKITDDYDLAYALTESFRLNEEDAANFSGDLQAMAPEHLKKVIDPSGELLATGPEGAANILKESIPWSSLNKEHLTPAQIEQISSPEFKAWFGDWEKGEGSKVVDRYGYPMVVFHGTPDDFSSFDKEDSIFFTDDRYTAKQFAEKDEYKGNRGQILKCFLNIRNPYVFDADWNDYDEIPFEDEQITTDELINKLSERGLLNSHDGLIIKNIRESVLCDHCTDYIPFSPKQIKSATSNSGKFDSKSSDIKESLITEFNKLTESILDIPQKDYYDGVIKDDKMTPECRKQIIDTIRKWKDQINFNFNIYKIWAKGSLLTKRYNDTTDLDISIYTDMSREQLNDIFDIIPKGQNILVDGKETDHPLDFYVLTKGEHTALENLDCIYDVAHNKWIKRDDSYDNDIPLEYVIQVANFFINGCAVAISNYENDKILYDYYKGLDPMNQEVSDDEKKEKIADQKNKLKADLDGMKVALRMISNFRQDAYNGENSRFLVLSIQDDIKNPHVTINEQLAKILEKFGIREKLRQYVQECQDILGLEETTGLQESLKDDDNTKIAVINFGRENPPTQGHLHMWKAIASVPADDHLIYTSHSQDKKKNPLDYETKAALIKMALAENNVDAEFVDSDARTLIDVAVDLYKKGYTDIIFVAGSDRIDDITGLLNKYNRVPNKLGQFYDFRSISGLNAGSRDPDSDGIEGVSASKVRQMAVDSDFEGFCKNIPISDKFILKEIYDQIRSVMM